LAHGLDCIISHSLTTKTSVSQFKTVYTKTKQKDRIIAIEIVMTLRMDGCHKHERSLMYKWKNLPRRNRFLIVLYMIQPCMEKHPKHYRRDIQFLKFGYKYFWHNWPSNDHSIIHLIQCLLLHYLKKKQNQRNMSWNEQKYIKKHPQH